jgi:DNA repair protein RecO (recombination protein O)
MSKEQRLTALVLKKQPYGEGDEIVTFFTKEEGKLRALAKSTKFSKSKLQYSLQVLFCINLTLSGRGGLPKIIGAEALETYSKIRESLECMKIAFYALELLIKFTPDEEENETLFNLFTNFLTHLNTYTKDVALIDLGLAKFKIQFLESLGLSIHTPTIPSEEIYFSNSKGGFVISEEGADHVPVDLVTLEQFEVLKQGNFASLPQLLSNQFFTGQSTEELQEVLSGFVRYQLEREIKSERYLGMV